jgi:hypothetical protein
MALPGLSLPWELCRAASHGKDFAVSIGPFAMQPIQLNSMLAKAIVVA